MIMAQQSLSSFHLIKKKKMYSVETVKKNPVNYSTFLLLIYIHNHYHIKLNRSVTTKITHTRTQYTIHHPNGFAR